MDIISVYREVGLYHGTAKICSTTPKTVKRVVEAAQRWCGADLRSAAAGHLPSLMHGLQTPPECDFGFVVDLSGPSGTFIEAVVGRSQESMFIMEMEGD